MQTRADNLSITTLGLDFVHNSHCYQAAQRCSLSSTMHFRGEMKDVDAPTSVALTTHVSAFTEIRGLAENSNDSQIAF
jgi:hypothetical protein